ncbi:ATP-binding cassette sub-family F member 3 [Trichonephila inaurata madagascariensis]|uniref:ATP-binding cassette sub-family F member 3 n=1 Tax=Trichonephila inaurata madagascariensis TaxID=2747483 RepID=A0A8X6YVN4_9ARAC|nr:ATP-binding cassette sub-family F member 3 [Trichonephila inaurata madagascariensis]
MAVTATNSILVSAFPSIDIELSNYIGGILDENKSEFESSDHVYETIGDFLHEAAGDSKDEKDIKELCSQLLKALKSDPEVKNKRKENKILSAPVCLGSLAENFENEAEELSSIWLKQRETLSCVDQRKLEKAEAKLKSKQGRRDNDKAPPVNAAILYKEATAVQATSRKETKMEQKGSNRNMDIKIENFDISFGDKTLLTGADLTLVYGRRYGMVGRNGIGKSTLLRMISSGQLKISNHLSILHVEQEVVGNDTIALDSVLECDEKRQGLIEEEKKVLHLLNNNGPSSEDSQSSGRLQEIYAELQLIESDKAPARASVILAGLGFSPEMQRKATKEFSGGWRMRIALARALFSKPDLLLLDEPTNMLDMKAIIWLENYLQTWESTILVVSHDRRFLDTVATDILHFHSQHIESYRGNYENFVKTMTEKLKHQQREYEAQQQYRAHAQEFIDKFRYNAKRASLVQSKLKMLEKLPELKPVEKESGVVLRFLNPEFLQPPVLQLDEVSFSYPSSPKLILNDVNLSANMGSRICIVGDNGSGKTTLLKLLIGDLNPIKGIRHFHRNLVIGYFTQHHVDQLDLNLSSLEFLAKRFPGKPSEEYRRQLGSFGVTGDLALQSVASLSGGQKSRVAFAAMAMLHPHFLILDEPTNHLDVETVEALGIALQNFTGGVVLVSHDEQLIEMVCQELWVCRNGSVSSISGGFSQYRKLVEDELAAQA